MSDAIAVPCVIDCDPGVDDVIALLLALSSPELLILAISVTHGNTTLPNALINLQKMFLALERHLQLHPEDNHKWPGLDRELRARYGVGKIQILAGSRGPIAGETVTAKYFHGLDGLSDITSRHPELSLPQQQTESAYYTLSPLSSTGALPGIMSSFPPSTIAYLALGPLTSLAQLHALASSDSSSLLHHFALILVMGGAVDAPGNTTPCAEFNTYGDPYAAKTVFALPGAPVYLFPLDLTTGITIPFELYTSLVDPRFVDPSEPSEAKDKGALTHFTSSFLEGTRAVMRQFGPDHMELHDPAVIWALIDWAKYRGAGNGVMASPTNSSSTVGGSPELEKRRGSEMRRRVEIGGFTRTVLERRRSLELVKAQRAGYSGRDGQLVVPDELTGEGEDEQEILEGEDGVTPLEASLGQLVGREGEDDGAKEFAEDEEELYDDDMDFAPGWSWTDREFEVETSGHLTRGMLVVDRRASAALAPSSRLANRAEQTIHEIDASGNVGDRIGRLSIASTSALEQPTISRGSGARVMVSSPGSDSIRTLLLERIWGVSIGLA